MLLLPVVAIQIIVMGTHVMIVALLTARFRLHVNSIIARTCFAQLIWADLHRGCCKNHCFKTDNRYFSNSDKTIVPLYVDCN